MIQRPGNCPSCGYWDPFHPSYFDPSRSVADLKWFEPWDHELLEILIETWPGWVTIEHQDGDWGYHLTKSGKSVERYPVSVLVTGIAPQERVGKTWRQRNGRSRNT
jgi:hypothetical protein